MFNTETMSELSSSFVNDKMMGQMGENILNSFQGIMPEIDLKGGSNITPEQSKKIGEITGFNMEIWEDTIALQDGFNERTIPGWKNKNLDWWMAILDEDLEILNSANWKWWKGSKNLKELNTKIDMENVEVELIDLFHFILSIAISQNKTNFMMAILIAGSKIESKLTSQEVIKKTRRELLLFSIIEVFEMVFLKWTEIWFGLGKNMDDLMKSYRIKNALNFIRQKFGYKENKYIKIWDKTRNAEDNVIAWELANEIPLDKNFYKTIISKLEEYYVVKVRGGF